MSATDQVHHLLRQSMGSRSIAALLLRDEHRSRELAELLDRQGFEAVCATNSDDFYNLLNHERADLVIIGHRLRGFMTGLEILERSYRDFLRPPTILLGQLNPHEAERCKRLGIDVVIESEDQLQEIAQQARVVVASSRHVHIPVPFEARQLVQDADCIQPLPQLVVKLCSYLDQPNASLEELARDITVDPKATAELLKLANSSALGRAFRTTDVHSAVKYLGANRTVSLIISASMLRAQSGLLAKVPESIRAWYNGRSVLIASTASAFASGVEQISPDTAYILGLLQDIGMLVLGHAYPERSEQNLQRVRQISHLRMECVEQNDFGFTHADVSAALLLKWEVPPSLVQMVLAHHDANLTSQRSLLEQTFVRIMQIGEAAANLADIHTTQRYQSLYTQLLAYGRNEMPRCLAALKDGIACTIESSRLFHVPIPDQEVLTQLWSRMTTFTEGGIGSQDDVVAPPAEPEIEPVRMPSVTPASLTERSDLRSNDQRGKVPVLARQSPVVASLDHREHAPPPELANVEPSRCPNLLVIDNELAIINLIRLQFSRRQVNVLGANSRAQAQSLAPKCSAIVCNVHLENENGIEIVRTLRGNGFQGPIIMMSEDCTRSTVMECIDAGIDEFLGKPFPIEALIRKLANHGLLFVRARNSQSPSEPPSELILS